MVHYRLVLRKYKVRDVLKANVSAMICIYPMSGLTAVYPEKPNLLLLSKKSSYQERHQYGNDNMDKTKTTSFHELATRLSWT